MKNSQIDSQMSRLKQLDSKTRNEFFELGIKNSSLEIISDMTSPENSNKMYELLLKISRSHKSIFQIKSGMTVYLNQNDDVIFDIDESAKRMGDNLCKIGKTLNDLSEDDDFQQRKAMREALRD
jgi:hypothetical protein